MPNYNYVNCPGPGDFVLEDDPNDDAAKPAMSRETAIKELRECQASDNPEEAHGTADDILCQLLTALGYEDVVLEYSMVTKWYA